MKIWNHDGLQRANSNSVREGDLMICPNADGLFTASVWKDGRWVEDIFQRTSQRGAANGYAALGADGKIATAQLPPGQGGGETNTASNVGTPGVGVFKTKVAEDLQFKSLASSSARLTVVDDVATSRVLLDVPSNAFEAAGAVIAHEAAVNPHVQYTTDAEATALAAAEVVAHIVADDPHPQYQRETEREQVNGYAGLDGNGKLTGSRQVYGTGANVACEGNDARLSDARAPTAHVHAQADVANLATDLAARVQVGGQLGNTASSPDVRGLRETAGPTLLTLGAVADGSYLRRSGSTLVGDTPGGGWNFVGKAVETDRRNNTLAADPDLKVVLAANTKYRIRVRVHYQTGATADFKYRYAGPAGFTVLNVHREHNVPGGTALVCAMEAAYSAADIVMVSAVANGQGFVRIDLVVYNGPTAGNFEFRWAQNTTTAGEACIVHAGSYLEWQAW